MADITRYSVYRNSIERYDEDGNLYTTDAEPFLYVDLPDNIEHIVSEGDTWWGIAHRYWHPIFQAASYWRFVSEFQPEPVTDPFVKPSKGTIVYVPSRSTLESRILASKAGVVF